MAGSGQALTRSFFHRNAPTGPPKLRAAAGLVGAMMKPRKPFHDDNLNADVGPDDGLDSRYDRRGGRPVGKRKALQLCREVERTLSAVLSGECDDDLLRELIVLSVVPAPNAVRLLVSVSLPASAGVPVEEAQRRLLGVAGRLRSEVAAAVSRRKAPELAFRVVTDAAPM
jgi:ribosome-binding factor A